MADFAVIVTNLASQPDYRPITLKAMSRRLEVPADDYAAFRATVKKLIQDGKLHLARDKTLSLPDRAGMIVGTFRRSAKGFGFVRLQVPRGKIDQVYIPIEATKDSSSGDEVAIEITRPSRRAGSTRRGGSSRSCRGPPEYLSVRTSSPGTRASCRSTARRSASRFPWEIRRQGCQTRRQSRHRDRALPQPVSPGGGGHRRDPWPARAPGVDTLTVIRAFNIPDTFEPAPLEQAREQARLFDEDNIGTRRDLRNVVTVTIDPATARDFDDAISLSRDDNGHWSLAVHIADVAHFVRSGSPLDHAARTRGTSVYLPDRVIPMLPEILSNSLASLQAGRTRYTVSALLDFTPDGILTAKRFARTAIRVDHRFTYEQAFEVMKQPGKAHEGVAPEVALMVGQMLELAMILRGRRQKRGARTVVARDHDRAGRARRGHRSASFQPRPEPPGDRGIHAGGE